MVDPEEQSTGEVYSFPHGMSKIADALGKALGPRVAKGAEVLEVRAKGDGVAVTYSHEGRTRTVEATCAILSTPAPVTTDIVKKGLSGPVREALSSIPYAPYATLNLFLKKRLWKKAWTASCLDEFFVTIYDSIRLQVSPDYDGASVLGVYIGPERQDDPYLLQAPEEEILARTLEGLKGYFPDIASQLAGYDLHRFKYAFPVFRPGYLEVLETLHQDATAQGPLVLAGDYTVYATVDGAVHSGYKAAELAREWLWD